MMIGVVLLCVLGVVVDDVELLVVVVVFDLFVMELL